MQKIEDKFWRCSRFDISWKNGSGAMSHAMFWMAPGTRNQSSRQPTYDSCWSRESTQRVTETDSNCCRESNASRKTDHPTDQASCSPCSSSSISEDQGKIQMFLAFQLLKQFSKSFIYSSTFGKHLLILQDNILLCDFNILDMPNFARICISYRFEHYYR